MSFRFADSSAKLIYFVGILNKTVLKYTLYSALTLLFAVSVFGARIPSNATLVSWQDTLRDDTLLRRPLPDSLIVDSLAADSLDTMPRKKDKPLFRQTKNFLDKPISGTNKDSLVYDLKSNMVYIYEQGDVKYDDMNMKADFMRVNIDTKDIHAFGKEVVDTTGRKTMTRPQFVQDESTYDMDTVTYNIQSGKAKVKGVNTQNGEGFIIGKNVKLMPDKSINI